MSASDNHACQAFLCFAGGLGEPSCASTIAKVKHDLMRGRAFPVCPFVDSSNGVIDGNSSPSIWTHSTKKRVYVYVQDENGQTKQVANIKKR